MPLLDTITDDLSSPLLGVYSSLALLVKRVVGVPLVADANRGNTAVAVLVSLDRDGGALTVPHEVFVPSVVRYLPDWDVWLGANALNAAFAVV